MEVHMIHPYYLIRELGYRRRRTFVSLLLVACSLAIFLFTGLLAGALQQAFQAPLADIGASLTVQKSGDVPEKMNGPVLPCSVAPLSREEIAAIGALPGVQSLSEVVLMWDFQPDSFQIVEGFDPEAAAGPALLRGGVSAGRFLLPDDRGRAMVDLSWAQPRGLVPGQKIEAVGQSFEIVGVVDSSQLGGIAAAHVYIHLAEAKAIASGSAAINQVHPFGPEDANLLFIRADRDQSDAIATAIKKIVGEKGAVSTPESFKELLGGLFALTDRFSLLVSGLTFVVALLLVARTTAAGVRERTMEIGAMKAVGWTGRNIVAQLAAESLVIVAVGAVVGIALGMLGAWVVSWQSIAIPIPWDMAPTPHFLPGGEVQLSRDVRLVMPPPYRLIGTALLLAITIGLSSLIVAVRAIIRLKPSEVLRHE